MQENSGRPHVDDATAAKVFASAQLRNKNGRLPDPVRAFFDERIRLHQHALEYRHDLAEMLRPTEEERRLRRKITTSVADRLDIRDEHARLRALVRERFAADQRRPYFSEPLEREIVVATLGRPFTLFTDATTEGEFWWAKTDWIFPVTHATIWFDDDGIHFTAKFDNLIGSTGDLHKYWIKFIAQFHLGADRLPPRGQRYVSLPFSEVLGAAYGYTLSADLFDFGDRWSKCWLNTRQTVFPFGRPDGILLWAGIGITAAESRQLIFLENSDSGSEHRTLPGFLAMPPVAFELPAETELVTAELEWEFHIQLEAESSLWLGLQPEAPICTLRHPQWHLRKA